MIDRANGKLISAEKYIEPNSFASHIDLETGRPVVLETADYTAGPRLITPNIDGAHSWHPMSYSPATGLVYFPVTQNWSVLEIDPNYRPRKFHGNFGVNQMPAESSAVWQDFWSRGVTGYLIAWNPVLQREAWRVPYGKGGNGGTLTTAGNLVVHGTSNQTLAIYRATDGKKLWERFVQTVPKAGPMTYTVDGEQFIAVSAGGVAVDRDRQKKPGQRSGGRILAFKLGGRHQLPAMPPAPEMPLPSLPKDELEEQIKRGSIAYHDNCAQCHGYSAVSVSTAPDLRFMSVETRAQFNDIVLKGRRSARGMQSFADILSEADANAIQVYVTVRARETWSNGNR